MYLPVVSNVAASVIPDFLQTFYPGIPLKKPAEQITSLVDISTITAQTGWQPRDLPHPALCKPCTA
ncbi:MAG: hypothetical protein HC898_04735 [Phycisphaerales bacterium]|nr:hypothetical protein [Phycisphaerales bacterium]